MKWVLPAHHSNLANSNVNQGGVWQAELVKRNAMLVLSRKVGERIRIGNDISITVVKVGSNGVRLGVEAPFDLPVMREELMELQPGVDEPAESDRGQRPR